MRIEIIRTTVIEDFDPKFMWADDEAPENPTTEDAVEELRSWAAECGYDDPAECFRLEWDLERRGEETIVIKIDGELVSEGA